MITLNATKREETGKAAARLREEGKLPAIVYGPNHEAEPITLELTDFTRILRNEGESTVLEVTGLGATFQALIHDIDHDPVTNTPRHADLYAIKKGAKVNVAVPLSYIGESAAAKAGASIVKVMHELEIESDPANLPHELEVDITALAEVGDQIHVKDIVLPKGVTTDVDGEEVVALAQEVQQEPEETVEAPDMDSIEVEQKGKEEGDGGNEEKGEE